jgi:hypothetical protein
MICSGHDAASYTAGMDFNIRAHSPVNCRGHMTASAACTMVFIFQKSGLRALTIALASGAPPSIPLSCLIKSPLARVPPPQLVASLA